MKGVVQFGDSCLEAFIICSGVKKGFVLAPNVFDILVAVMLKHAFEASFETDGSYGYTRTGGRLCRLIRLRAKSIIREVLIRDIVDDIVLAVCLKSQL